MPGKRPRVTSAFLLAFSGMSCTHANCSDDWEARKEAASSNLDNAARSAPRDCKCDSCLRMGDLIRPLTQQRCQPQRVISALGDTSTTEAHFRLGFPRDGTKRGASFTGPWGTETLEAALRTLDASTPPATRASTAAEGASAPPATRASTEADGGCAYRHQRCAWELVSG